MKNLYKLHTKHHLTKIKRLHTSQGRRNGGCKSEWGREYEKFGVPPMTDMRLPPEKQEFFGYSRIVIGLIAVDI